MYILKKLNEEKHVKTKELADRYIAEGYTIVSEPERKQDVVDEPETGKKTGRSTNKKPADASAVEE